MKNEIGSLNYLEKPQSSTAQARVWIPPNSNDELSQDWEKENNKMDKN